MTRCGLVLHQWWKTPLLKKLPGERVEGIHLPSGLLAVVSKTRRLLIDISSFEKY